MNNISLIYLRKIGEGYWLLVIKEEKYSIYCTELLFDLKMKIKFENMIYIT